MGVLVKNDPLGPRDYEYLCDWSSTVTTPVTEGGGCVFSYYMTWGNPYLGGTTGWLLQGSTNTYVPVPVTLPAYAVSFTSPWGSWSDSGAVFLSTDTFLVKVYDEQLTGDCDTFTHSFSSLELYVNGTLVLTIGAQSDSGTGYDDRNNNIFIDPNAGSFPPVVVYPDPQPCPTQKPPAVPPIPDDTSLAIESKVIGVWRINNGGVYEYPAIAIVDPTPIDDPGCSACPLTWGFNWTDSSWDNTSWNLVVKSYLNWDVTWTLIGTRTCHSNGHPPCTQELFYSSTTFESSSPTITLTRRDGPIRAHHDFAQEKCYVGDTGITTDSDVTDAYAICGQTQNRVSHREKVCCFFVTSPPCLVDPDFPVECDIPDCDVNYVCHHIGAMAVTWPVKPGCSDQTGPNYIVEDSEGRLHLGAIIDGDVWYKRSNDTRSADHWVSVVQLTTRGDVIKCAFDYDSIYKRFELYFETTTHDVFYTYTLDEGKTWFAESLVGSNMTDYFTATNHSNGDRIRCWFQWNTGTSGVGKAYGQFRRFGDSSWSATFNFKNSGTALAVADGGMCNVAWAFSNQGELVWSPRINGDTDPSTWYSNDEGRNWRLQT